VSRAVILSNSEGSAVVFYGAKGKQILHSVQDDIRVKKEYFEKDMK
jgi:hypothetical protein